MRVGMVVLLFAGVTMALSGCGSNSMQPPTDQVLEPRIQEYVGDGGGSLKPWPDFLAPLGFDSPSVTGPKLKEVNAPKTGKVARKQVSWYRLQANPNAGYDSFYVVTLQPTAADEDSDLFVLEGKAKDYDDGAQTLACSRRAPSDTDSVTGGGAPDWVTFMSSPSAGWPAGHVAVLGVNEEPAVKHFRIELDQPWLTGPGIQVYSRSVQQQDSDWWLVPDVVAGTHYTVLVDDTGAGDPDVFVYGSDATKFIAKHTATGDASIGFTATESGDHYIRVYGYSPNPNDYSIEVTSP